MRLSFHLNTPVLVTKIDTAIGKAGEPGTLAASLNAIKEQARPKPVIVRVENSVSADDEEKAADQAVKVIGPHRQKKDRTASAAVGAG
ncbi:hypothetical protein [Acidovorax kalamii]|uniref:Tail sheath protein Gp18-like domain-containing protein n=1 Tax=Acidovorax kalamii TaxID=2004485 RepID=A0A235EIH0_9BURK|nr:hypothetical protein [Acidovorax kalamii]OYD48804.1 hypothetical protein CBY09_18505 [Acidovorax kalamii]